MKIFNTITDIRYYLNSLRSNNYTIGFVPTMGALHDGHLELIKRSQKENQISVCSIFVNPIQFNNPDDLKIYPRKLEKDIEKLLSIHCDVLFNPSVKEMYPKEIKKQYDFGILGNVMEAKFRPNHFNGVATVVKLLFDIINPHKAYFGEKDFQQLIIIKQLVKKENLNVEIIPCLTIREKDGLAISSRNIQLTDEERHLAPIIYKTLLSAKKKIHTHSIKDICHWATNKLNSVSNMRVEYFEIVNGNTLESIDQINITIPIMAFVAVNLGKVRLIDNIRLV